MAQVTDTAANVLRPTTWDDYIGQTRLKDELKIRIASAIDREAAFPHTLLIGPAGAGKTTLAAIIAHELGESFTVYDCPFGEDDYRKLRGDDGIKVLEEFHRLTSTQREDWLCALENDYMHPKGNPRMSWSGFFTVIALTTEPGKILRPIRARFMIQPFFDPYTDEEMRQIVQGMCERMKITLAPKDCMGLGKASAGVPRRASNFVTAARDLMVVQGKTPNAAKILDFMRCTEDGMTPHHIIFIKALYDQGALGLQPLKQMLDMDDGGVAELESLLGKLGYVEKTKKGRGLTPTGFRRAKEIIDGASPRSEGRRRNPPQR